MSSQRLARVFAAASITTLGAFAAPAPVHAGTAPAYTNPVFARDFPDPFVLNVNGTYYAYSTQSGGANVPVISSADMVSWQSAGDALPALPAWAQAGNTWAPSILQRGTRFVMYYTVHSAALNKQCISIALADTPTGPFTDNSTQPFICQDALGGSIDPAPFLDLSGAPYLVWKADTWFGTSTLWTQQLSPDGTTLLGSPTQILSADQAWEERVVEAPFMVARDGRYWLFFSGSGWFSARYATGYASCSSPSGPCVPSPANPIYTSRDTALGPGSASFFLDAAGGTHIAYHAWTAPLVGYGAGGRRTLRIDDAHITGSGVELFGPTTSPTNVGGVVMDAWGGLHPWGGLTVNTAGAAYWRGWRIARAAVLVPGGGGGYTLDGWGGVHAFGDAAPFRPSGYWPGWDIARGITYSPAQHGGYVLDGWGGLHAYGGAPPTNISGYWPGWDIARALAACPNGVDGGYVLDGFGGLHQYGAAQPIAPPAYWPGWDIARSVALTSCEGGTGSGYVLDGWGGIHSFGSAPAAQPSAYWRGQDIARSITLAAGGGYVLNGWGGVHAFGSAPRAPGSASWSSDFARGISAG